jgi:hypothetical protein
MTKTADPRTVRDLISGLYQEVDCRIEHGADSSGHLEFVRKELLNILLRGCDGA